MSSAFGTDPFQEKRSLALFWDIADARARFQANVKKGLLRLLIDHRGTSATCTKDKIYALLGLLDICRVTLLFQTIGRSTRLKMRMPIQPIQS
jgi:hypothetical protein